VKVPPGTTGFGETLTETGPAGGVAPLLLPEEEPPLDELLLDEDELPPEEELLEDASWVLMQA